MNEQFKKKARVVLPFIAAFFLGLGVFFMGPVGSISRPPPDVPPPGPVEKADVHLFIKEGDGYGGLSEAAQRGAGLATEQINRSGGVLGKSLRLSFASLDGNAPAPEPALFALFAGAEEDKTAAIAWAEENKTPLFLLTDGPCRTVTSTPDAPSPYIWSLGLTWRSTVEPLFVYLNDLYSRPDKPFTLFYIGGETPERRQMIEFAQSEAEALSFRTIDTQFFDLRTADYHPTIRYIISKAPHVLFISDPGLAGRVFMQQAAKIGAGKEMAIASLDTFIPEFFDSDDSSLEGVYTVAKYSRELPGEENAKFVASLKEKGAPEYVLSGNTAAMSYTAVKLAAAALKKAGKSEPEAFAAALGGLEISAPSGKVRMSAVNHILEQPLFVARREKQHWIMKQDLGTAIHPRLEDCGGGPAAPAEE